MRTGKRRRSPYAPKPIAAPPTERQEEFLAAIRALTEENGRSPSTVEIAARLGITHSGARQQLHALEARGRIGDVPKTVRSGRWFIRPEQEQQEQGGK